MPQKNPSPLKGKLVGAPGSKRAWAEDIRPAVEWLKSNLPICSIYEPTITGIKKRIDEAFEGVMK